MKPLTLQQVAGMAGGRLLHGAPDATVTAVSTDTRTIPPGSLFVALVGERFDAHAFLGTAASQGATAALVSRAVEDVNLPQILVDDTLAGLQRLAAAYRDTFSGFLAVGITGSNGKTSTKDFVHAVFRQRFAVNATKGNLNNHIGLPLTVLATDSEHTAGIFEMGMNHPGEIAPLAAIARPEIGVVTMIGTAHIEYMGTREAIALEKGALIEALPANGVAVLNANDDMTPALAARTRARVLTAGIGTGDVRAENVQGASFDLMLAPPVRVTLPVPGRHMVSNALLAAAVGHAVGLSPAEIKAGLEAAHIHGGRLTRREVGGLHFLDDSYNANPDSMLAAFRTMADEPVQGRRIAVLGRMAELGTHSEAGHRQVGEAAAREGVDVLLTVGADGDDARLIHESFGDPARALHFSTHAEAAHWLRAHATPADFVLLKGSRSAGMERVIHALAPDAPATAAH